MFGTAMRTASLKLHGRDMAPTNRPPTALGFARYLAEQREIHAALHRFPVHTRVNLSGAADLDLLVYEDGLPLVDEPYVSEYAEHLNGLPVHLLGCHWFNAVFAHLSGGGLAIAKAASPVLPSRFLETSELYNPREDVGDLKDRFELEAMSWTTSQRVACLRETPSAFSRQRRVQSLISSS